MKTGKDLTLIVGGGPAGSACAFELTKSGRSCLLLEKEEFPREKVCGGILSHRAASVLVGSGMISTEELEDLTLRKHSTITFWDRGEYLRRYTSPSDPVRIISRSRFDGFLLQRAASAGAEVRTGQKVESVDKVSAATSSGESVFFRHLVGADGTTSIVRRLVSGRRSRKTGMGIHYLVPLPELEQEPEGLEIHFGHIPYGYIWVIPGTDSVNIGAGALGSPVSPSDIVEALGKFMGSIHCSVSHRQLRGAAIPSLVLHRDLGKGNIYLAGDAAGLVDQVSGEGIGHAAESGMLVARCILSGDRRGTLLKRSGNCIDMVRQSTFYRHLLHSRPARRTAMMSLRDSEEFARGYWNIISGKESYNEMFSRILG